MSTADDSHSPPAAVRRRACRALKERSKKPPSQRGMTAVGVARARDLCNGRPVSRATLKRMASFFARHAVDKKGSTWGEYGKGRQAWDGWGGDPGAAWARRKVAQLAKSSPAAATVAALVLGQALSKMLDINGPGIGSAPVIGAGGQTPSEAAWLFDAETLRRRSEEATGGRARVAEIHLAIGAWRPKRGEHLRGGDADGMDARSFDRDALTQGALHELEHTDKVGVAIEIAMDHLAEDPDYYQKLQAIEKASQQMSLFGGGGPAATPHTVQQHLARNPGGLGVHVVAQHQAHHRAAVAPAPTPAPAPAVAHAAEPLAAVQAGQTLHVSAAQVTTPKPVNDLTASVSARRGKTYHDLSTSAREWEPVEVEGFEVQEDGANGRAMPVFNLPRDYQAVTTRFSGGGSDDMACELCGAKIKTVYYIVHHDKKLSMQVGNVCIGNHLDAVAPESVQVLRRILSLKVKPEEVEPVNELMRKGVPAGQAVARVRARSKAERAFDAKTPRPTPEQVAWWNTQRSRLRALVDRRNAGEYLPRGDYDLLRDPYDQKSRIVHVEQPPQSIGFELRDAYNVPTRWAREHGRAGPRDPRLTDAMEATINELLEAKEWTPELRQGAKALLGTSRIPTVARHEQMVPLWARIDEDITTTWERERAEAVESAELAAAVKTDPTVVRLGEVAERARRAELTQEDKDLINTRFDLLPKDKRYTERGTPITTSGGKLTAVLEHTKAQLEQQPLVKVAPQGAGWELAPNSRKGTWRRRVAGRWEYHEESRHSHRSEQANPHHGQRTLGVPEETVRHAIDRVISTITHPDLDYLDDQGRPLRLGMLTMVTVPVVSLKGTPRRINVTLSVVPDAFDGAVQGVHQFSADHHGEIVGERVELTIPRQLSLTSAHGQRELRRVLAHELAHAIDPRVEADAQRKAAMIRAGRATGAEADTRPKGAKDYYNRPEEVVAFRHNIFREMNDPAVAEWVREGVSLNVDRMEPSTPREDDLHVKYTAKQHGRDDEEYKAALYAARKRRNRLIQEVPWAGGGNVVHAHEALMALEQHSQTWRRVGKHLTPPNRRKMLEMVGTLLQRHADGKSAPMEKGGDGEGALRAAVSAHRTRTGAERRAGRMAALQRLLMLSPPDLGPPPTPNREEYPFEGSLDWRGLRILVENKAGSTRSGVDPNGKPWSIRMLAHYGEFDGSEGTDGDPLDVYVGPHLDAPVVYVVHQKVPGTTLDDEDKVIIGVDGLDQARALYFAQYNKRGFWGGCTRWPVEEFVAAVKSGHVHGKKLDGPSWVRQRLGKALEESSLGVLLAKVAQMHLAFAGANTPHAAHPPKGYEPIPNSRHGGYRRRVGSGGWRYWYPDVGHTSVARAEISTAAPQEPAKVQPTDRHHQLAADLTDLDRAQEAHGQWANYLQQVHTELGAIEKAAAYERFDRAKLMERVKGVRNLPGPAFTERPVHVGGLHVCSASESIAMQARELVESECSRLERRLTNWDAGSKQDLKLYIARTGGGLQYDASSRAFRGGPGFRLPDSHEGRAEDESVQQVRTMLARGLAEVEALPATHQTLLRESNVQVRLLVAAVNGSVEYQLDLGGTATGAQGGSGPVIRLYDDGVEPVAGAPAESNVTLVHEVGHIIDHLLRSRLRTDVREEFLGRFEPDRREAIKGRAGAEDERHAVWRHSAGEWLAEAYRYAYRDGGPMKTSLQAGDFDHQDFRAWLDGMVRQALASHLTKSMKDGTVPVLHHDDPVHASDLHQLQVVHVHEHMRHTDHGEVVIPAHEVRRVRVVPEAVTAGATGDTGGVRPETPSQRLQALRVRAEDIAIDRARVGHYQQLVEDLVRRAAPGWRVSLRMNRLPHLDRHVVGVQPPAGGPGEAGLSYHALRQRIEALGLRYQHAVVDGEPALMTFQVPPPEVMEPHLHDLGPDPVARVLEPPPALGSPPRPIPLPMDADERRQHVAARVTMARGQIAARAHQGLDEAMRLVAHGTVMGTLKKGWGEDAPHPADLALASAALATLAQQPIPPVQIELVPAQDDRLPELVARVGDATAHAVLLGDPEIDRGAARLPERALWSWASARLGKALESLGVERNSLAWLGALDAAGELRADFLSRVLQKGQPELGAQADQEGQERELVDALQGVLVSGVTQAALGKPWDLDMDGVVLNTHLYERLLVAAVNAGELVGADWRADMRRLLEERVGQVPPLAAGAAVTSDEDRQATQQALADALQNVMLVMVSRRALQDPRNMRAEDLGPVLPGAANLLATAARLAARLGGNARGELPVELAKARRLAGAALGLVLLAKAAGAQQALFGRASASHEVQAHTARNPGGAGVHVVAEHLSHHAAATAHPGSSGADKTMRRQDIQRIPAGQYRIVGYHDTRPIDWASGKRLPGHPDDARTCHRCTKQHWRVYEVEGPQGRFEVGQKCAGQMLEGFDPTGEQFQAAVRAHESAARVKTNAAIRAEYLRQADLIAAEVADLPAVETRVEDGTLTAGARYRAFHHGDAFQRVILGGAYANRDLEQGPARARLNWLDRRVAERMQTYAPKLDSMVLQQAVRQRLHQNGIVPSSYEPQWERVELKLRKGGGDLTALLRAVLLAKTAGTQLRLFGEQRGAPAGANKVERPGRAAPAAPAASAGGEREHVVRAHAARDAKTGAVHMVREHQAHHHAAAPVAPAAPAAPVEHVNMGPAAPEDDAIEAALPEHAPEHVRQAWAGMTFQEARDKHGARNAAAHRLVAHTEASRHLERHQNADTSTVLRAATAELMAEVRRVKPRVKHPEIDLSQITTAERGRDAWETVARHAEKHLGAEAVRDFGHRLLGQDALARHRTWDDATGALLEAADRHRADPHEAVFAAQRGKLRQIDVKSGDAHDIVHALRGRGFTAHVEPLEYRSSYDKPRLAVVTDAPEHAPVHAWASMGPTRGRPPGVSDQRLTELLRRDARNRAEHLAVHGLGPYGMAEGSSTATPFNASLVPDKLGKQRYVFPSREAAEAAVHYHDVRAQDYRRKGANAAARGWREEAARLHDAADAHARIMGDAQNQLVSRGRR